MANQELYKLENAVRKAESAWDRQMKRDGHLKKESRDISTAEPKHMSPTARAFFYEYTASKSLLDAEAGKVDLFGGTPSDPVNLGGDAPAEKGKGKKGGHLSVVTHQYPRPDEVITPEGMPRRIVAPETLTDWRALSATETIAKDKPTAKVVQLDEQHWVVVEVGEGYAVLNRCIPEDQYEGNTVPNLADRQPGDWDGLLFRSGPGRSPSFVLLNSTQSMACLAGDPLADVKLNDDEAASQ
jgi:hypothetical protein